MTEELVKPPFTRYYLRQPHGLNNKVIGSERTGAQAFVDAYVGSHNTIKELPYILTIKPSQIDDRWPQRTSNHYTMFVSIMEKYEETFEKELFKLSLQHSNIEIAKKETIPYLRHKDGIEQ